MYSTNKRGLGVWRGGCPLILSGRPSGSIGLLLYIRALSSARRQDLNLPRLRRYRHRLAAADLGTERPGSTFQRQPNVSVLRRQQCRRRGIARMKDEDAAMGWVDCKKERIVQRQRLGCAGADDVEEQRRVSAIGVSIDRETLGLDRAVAAARRIDEVQAARGVTFDGLLAAFDLAPSDLSIAVIIQLQDEVQIA